MPIRHIRTLMERINALPEPYRSNLVEWFRCGLDWPIHAPCDGLVTLGDLLRSAPLAYLVQLSQVLKETEQYFGTAHTVTNWPVTQTVSAYSS